jgi:hypothetical protein
MNLFFRFSSSSLNMIDFLVRFPYTSVKLLPVSVARVVLIIDITGVMPLPAAKAR